ncbi:hypothetical protein ACQKP1_08795 [Allorhizobium sp. NPDC080224]|uniref:hypothetical protein n=1 Tax=Allorhizobium sp. NPDC080224 TaxID=3390547 RepID=UPI00394D0A13
MSLDLGRRKFGAIKHVVCTPNRAAVHLFVRQVIHPEMMTLYMVEMVAANTKYSTNSLLPPDLKPPPGGQKSHKFPGAEGVVRTPFHLQESRYNV